jgi:hypothetical protein
MEWKLNRRDDRAIPVAQPSRLRVQAPSRCECGHWRRDAAATRSRDGRATAVPPPSRHRFRPADAFICSTENSEEPI